MRRGEIYLVNFGKIRPALVIQNDIANRNIDKVNFKGVTLMPLTTVISGGNLRVIIPKRDKIQKDSEICINELCTLDISRIELDNMLTTLSDNEMEDVSKKLVQHLGLR